MKLFALILAATILTLLMAVGTYASIAAGMWPCVLVIALAGIWLQNELFDAIASVIEKE